MIKRPTRNTHGTPNCKPYAPWVHCDKDPGARVQPDLPALELEAVCIVLEGLLDGADLAGDHTQNLGGKDEG